MNCKDTIWTVPLYCIISGFVAFYIVVAIIARFAIVILSDGTVTSDDTKEMIIYGIIFLFVVLLGKKIFCHMTKKEIFVSASILVVFQFIITLIQCYIGKMSLTTALVFMYLSQISEWSRVVSLLLWKVTNHIWLGAFVEAFAPYIFVLFGLKNTNEKEYY